MSFSNYFPTACFSRSLRLSRKRESDFRLKSRTEAYTLVECQGYFKIGQTTKSVEDRITGFSTITLPFDFVPVYSVLCSDRYNAESRVHTLLKNFRVRGEWFRLDPHFVTMTKILMQTYSDYQGQELGRHLLQLVMTPGFWDTDEDDGQPSPYLLEATVARLTQIVRNVDDKTAFWKVFNERFAASSALEN